MNNDSCGREHRVQIFPERRAELLQWLDAMDEL